MDTPQVLFTLRWFVRDTFRQALASRIFWVVLGVSALCIVFCLSISVEGARDLRPDGDFLYHPDTGEPVASPTSDLGRLCFFFGSFRVGLARDCDMAIHMIHVVLGMWMAGAVGLLLTLIWTAGFVPHFLEPQNAAVLFTKPVPRWLSLVGRYLGVVILVGVQAGIFFVGTWLALGVRTGYWDARYLAGIPVLLGHFATIYGFSVLLGAVTRSSVAAAIGTVLFWVVCLGMNYGRHAAVGMSEFAPNAAPLSSFTMFLIDAAYWIMPKPIDFIMMLEQALGASAHMGTLASVPEFAAARSTVDFGTVLICSLFFTVASVGLAGRHVETIDY